MALPVAQRRFTWAEVLRMAQAGILHEDDRLELVQGHLVELPPIGEGPAHLVVRIDHLLRRGLGDRAICQVQNPLGLTRYTVVQPDGRSAGVPGHIVRRGRPPGRAVARPDASQRTLSRASRDPRPAGLRPTRPVPRPPQDRRTWPIAEGESRCLSR